MNTKEIVQKAEDLALKYNSEGYIPFPFDKIAKDNEDLEIYYSDGLDPNISGGILFDSKEKVYPILVNNIKSEEKIQLAIAHELGHYFLHKEYIRSRKTLVDTEKSLDCQISFGEDYSKYEIEANIFATSLIMPEKFVQSVWFKLKNVERCAKVFKVPVSIMSIRLEGLKLL